jgi:ethanolamine permease
MYQLTDLSESKMDHHSVQRIDPNVSEVDDDYLQDDHSWDSRSDDRSPDGPSQEVKRKYAENSRFIQIANFWDVLAFGICIASANLTYGAWHVGLVLGFWSYFFAVLIIATVFFALHFCIAEMISILPFSGGMYGFARVTVGPYLGFMVGCYESIGNIIYTYYGMIQLGYYICYITETPKRYVPCYWLAFYTLMIGNEFLGRKYYFRLIRVTAILILLIFLFYVAISIPKEHPDKYFNDAQDVDKTFFYGAELTVVSLQYAAFIYFAIEIIPLVSDEVQNAKRDTPRALIATLIFITVFALVFMFLIFTQFPGYPWVVLFNRAPLNPAFKNTFPEITDRVATVFAYLPLLATVSMYIFGFSKQLRALGSSKLLPAPFAWTMKGTKIPYMSLLIGSGLSFMLCMISYCRDETGPYTALPAGLYLAGYLFTYFAFLIVLISFIVFRIKYYNLKREFTSPLGIGGAIYAMCGILLLLYILIRYTNRKYTYVKIFACCTGIMSVYYYFYARQRQTFSEEEQKVMFVVYLMQCKIVLFILGFISFNHFLYSERNEEKRASAL